MWIYFKPCLISWAVCLLYLNQYLTDLLTIFYRKSLEIRYCESSTLFHFSKLFLSILGLLLFIQILESVFQVKHERLLGFYFLFRNNCKLTEISKKEYKEVSCPQPPTFPIGDSFTWVDITKIRKLIGMINQVWVIFYQFLHAFVYNFVIFYHIYIACWDFNMNCERSTAQFVEQLRS